MNTYAQFYTCPTYVTNKFPIRNVFYKRTSGNHNYSRSVIFMVDSILLIQYITVR